MRLKPWTERARAKSPLPEGSLAVGAGLVLAGLAAYGFLVISARALGAERYASLSALWALMFVVAPGAFLPIEQELSRALSARIARGVGGAPVARRAAAAGGVLAAVVVIASLAGAGPLMDRLFDGQVFLLLGLTVGLVAYSAQHLTRGILAGNRRFGRYGMVIAGDGVLRLAGCIALALAAVDEAGPYGLVMGVAPLAAIAFGLWGERNLLTPGPEARWGELSSALGYLFAGSAFAQLLVNAGPLSVKLLATDAEQAAAGRFLAGLVIARVPLFLFQAVQAALLPKLSGIAATRPRADFVSGLKRMVFVVVAIGIAATLGGIALGPWALRLLFGPEFELARRDFGYLAGASAAFMLASALAQALIALSSYARAALAWLIGIGSFFTVTALGSDLLLRAEQGFLVGSLAAAGAMALLLRSSLPLAKWHSQDELVEAALQIPIEP